MKSGICQALTKWGSRGRVGDRKGQKKQEKLRMRNRIRGGGIRENS